MTSRLALLSVFLFLAPLAKAQNKGALTVTNGDFSTMEGLTAHSPSGWYSGVPAGWTAAKPPAKKEKLYAVRNLGATGFFANLQALSRTKPQFEAFHQEIGVLAEASVITLTFDAVDIRDEIGDEAFTIGAAIVDARAHGAGAILAKADFEAAGSPRLVATKVPAGTRLAIWFWAVKGFPGIGNVTIEATPLALLSPAAKDLYLFTPRGDDVVTPEEAEANRRVGTQQIANEDVAKDAASTALQTGGDSVSPERRRGTGSEQRRATPSP